MTKRNPEMSKPPTMHAPSAVLVERVDRTEVGRLSARIVSVAFAIERASWLFTSGKLTTPEALSRLGVCTDELSRLTAALHDALNESKV